MLEKDENTNNSEFTFFEAIKKSNIPEIVKYFRNENLKPWEYLDEDEYTGN